MTKPQEILAMLDASERLCSDLVNSTTSALELFCCGAVIRMASEQRIEELMEFASRCAAYAARRARDLEFWGMADSAAALLDVVRAHDHAAWLISREIPSRPYSKGTYSAARATRSDAREAAQNLGNAQDRVFDELRQDREELERL